MAIVNDRYVNRISRISAQATYFGVDSFEGGIILVDFKIDLSGGDGQRPSSHYHRGNELSRGAEDHRACTKEDKAVRLLQARSATYW